MAKKKILYFEDESTLFIDFIDALSEFYEVYVSTEKKFIETERDYIFDLLILDIQIFNSDYDDDDNMIENLQFNNIYWRDTGIEFLRRIRQGQYEKNGFPSDMVIVAATVRADIDITNELLKHDINLILEKPFTIDDLLNNLQQVI